MFFIFLLFQNVTSLRDLAFKIVYPFWFISFNCWFLFFFLVWLWFLFLILFFIVLKLKPITIFNKLINFFILWLFIFLIDLFPFIRYLRLFRFFHFALTSAATPLFFSHWVLLRHWLDSLLQFTNPFILIFLLTKKFIFLFNGSLSIKRCLPMRLWRIPVPYLFIFLRLCQGLPLQGLWWGLEDVLFFF